MNRHVNWALVLFVLVFVYKQTQSNCEKREQDKRIRKNGINLKYKRATKDRVLKQYGRFASLHTYLMVKTVCCRALWQDSLVAKCSELIFIYMWNRIKFLFYLLIFFPKNIEGLGVFKYFSVEWPEMVQLCICVLYWVQIRFTLNGLAYHMD